MNQPRTKLQQLLDAFRQARYPGGFPTARDEDALAKRLMSEIKDWCNQQGLAAALDQALQEAAVLDAAEELEDGFAGLAAEGKAQSICVPKADGTMERRWSMTSKNKAPPKLRADTRDRN